MLIFSKGASRPARIWNENDSQLIQLVKIESIDFSIKLIPLA